MPGRPMTSESAFFDACTVGVADAVAADASSAAAAARTAAIRAGRPKTSPFIPVTLLDGDPVYALAKP